MTEKVVLKTKPTIVEYRRDIKQIHLGKCGNGKLHTSPLVNDEVLISTPDFASAFNNANNVKTSDLLAFLEILLFSCLLSCPKIISGTTVHPEKLHVYENIHWGN